MDDLGGRLLGWLLGRSCLRNYLEERERFGHLVWQVVGVDEQLDGRLNLLVQGLEGGHRVVQVSDRQVNDHACDLGRVLHSHQLSHISKDVSADDLLLLGVRRIDELLTHEDTHHVLTVLG